MARRYNQGLGHFIHPVIAGCSRIPLVLAEITRNASCLRVAGARDEDGAELSYADSVVLPKFKQKNHSIPPLQLDGERQLFPREIFPPW